MFCSINVKYKQKCEIFEIPFSAVYKDIKLTALCENNR